MKSFALPAFTALVVAVGAMWSAVTAYRSSGTLPISDAVLLLAAIAVAVLTVRLYEAEKKIDELSRRLPDEREEEQDAE